MFIEHLNRKKGFIIIVCISGVHDNEAMFTSAAVVFKGIDHLCRNPVGAVGHEDAGGGGVPQTSPS